MLTEIIIIVPLVIKDVKYIKYGFTKHTKYKYVKKISNLNKSFRHIKKVVQKTNTVSIVH